MSRSLALPLWMVLLVLFTGCQQTGRAYNADDGSLYRHLFAASATVLVDGEIAGAGAFVGPDGRFLTAAHVVNAPRDRIELLLTDGTTLGAEKAAIDLGHDLAVLSTGVERAAGQWLAFADGPPPPPGTPIYMVGAPSMYEETFVPGRIARGRLGFNFLGDYDCYIHSLLIIADTAPGTSGGGWVDGDGRLVGVQSSFIGDDLGTIGLAFIGPGHAARELVERGRDRSATTLGGELVGLRTQAYDYTSRFPDRTTGVAVYRVFDGGPIDRAGIPADHVITHIDAEPVANVDQLYNRVRRHEPGDTVSLTVLSPDSHAVKDYAVELDALDWD